MNNICSFYVVRDIKIKINKYQNIENDNERKLLNKVSQRTLYQPEYLYLEDLGLPCTNTNRGPMNLARIGWQ